MDRKPRHLVNSSVKYLAYITKVTVSVSFSLVLILKAWVTVPGNNCLKKKNPNKFGKN